MDRRYFLCMLDDLLVQNSFLRLVPFDLRDFPPGRLMIHAWAALNFDQLRLLCRFFPF